MPARKVIESFSESSARAKRTSFCKRSAKSEMTFEMAFGSEDCSFIVVARRIARRLDGRRRHGTIAGSLERPVCEEPGERRKAKHQRRLPPSEIGRALDQLLNGLILKAIRVMVDIVSKSSHETGEHRAFSFQIVSGNPHGTGQVIGRLSANANLVVQKAHDMVGHARGCITCSPFSLLGRI